MTEWPGRTRENSDSYFESSIDEFHKLWNDQSVSNLAPLVTLLTKSKQDNLDAADTLAKLLALSRCNDNPTDEALISDADIVLIAACVQAISTDRTCLMWEYVWSLAWHSATLDTYLPLAIQEKAKSDRKFKTSIIKIAKGISQKLSKDPGRRCRESTANARRQLALNWQQSPNLHSIWGGLIAGQNEIDYHDDGIFRILVELDLKAFVEVLSSFTNPYLVQYAFMVGKASYKFDRWQKLLELSPAAFYTNGEWSGSVLLPLLLTIAQEQLINTHRIKLNPSHQEVATTSKRLEDLSTEVCKSLNERVDALVCAKRWATWLMRQTLLQNSDEMIQNPAAFTSKAYANYVLLNSLARTFNSLSTLIYEPTDEEPWEAWCFRCVLVLIALTCNLAMPDSTEFLEAWSLSSDDWSSAKGKLLRVKSSLFSSIASRPDAFGTRLLAIGVAFSGNADDLWLSLWHRSRNIREIIEFGDQDELDNSRALESSRQASGLMQLAFGLGLMMFDYLLESPPAETLVNIEVMERLLQCLCEARAEMEEIDQYHREYWRTALIHLFLRRAIWSKKLPADAKIRVSLCRLLIEVVDKPEGLINLIEIAMRNGVEAAVLKTTLSEAKIDLGHEIKQSQLLLQLNTNQIKLSLEQINQVAQLL